MLEQKISELFGDSDPTGFGTGWWSGVLSAFFGVLAFGAVVCLHFPQLLTSPELRPYYPVDFHAMSRRSTMTTDARLTRRSAGVSEV